MPILLAGSSSPSMTLFALSRLFTGDATSASTVRHNGVSHKICLNYAISKRPFSFHGVVRSSASVSGDARTKDGEEEAATATANAVNGAPYPDAARQARRSADWKAARAYNESGLIYTGRVEGFNGGGLLVQFYSLVGFLPFPQLSPSHPCKEPDKNIQEVAKALTGSVVPVKINVGDIFQARVGSVEDYGAFVHLRFLDGLYHLTGLVHVSEVSWDLVQDVRDILSEGDEVRVKVINIDRRSLVRRHMIASRFYMHTHGRKPTSLSQATTSVEKSRSYPLTGAPSLAKHRRFIATSEWPSLVGPKIIAVTASRKLVVRDLDSI